MTSPLSKEFAFSVLGAMYESWDSNASSNSWGVVDMFFDALVERNPDFRVVLRGIGFITRGKVVVKFSGFSKVTYRLFLQRAW